MKKLSEFRDDEAMDVLAEILEPAVNIAKNKDFVDAYRGTKDKKPNRVEAVKIVITDNRPDVVKIMAVLNETPVEEFHYNILTLPTMLLQILNDKDMASFFLPQGETDSATSSGSVMENTEAEESSSSDM